MVFGIVLGLSEISTLTVTDFCATEGAFVDLGEPPDFGVATVGAFVDLGVSSVGALDDFKPRLFPPEEATRPRRTCCASTVEKATAKRAKLKSKNRAEIMLTFYCCFGGLMLLQFVGLNFYETRKEGRKNAVPTFSAPFTIGLQSIWDCESNT